MAKEGMTKPRIKLLGRGPINGAWIGQFLKCPICGELVEKKGYDSCQCGNIAMDADYLRVAVYKSKESEIEQYGKDE